MRGFDLIEDFFDKKYIENKGIQQYITEKKWTLQDFGFNEKIIAVANVDTNTIIINSKVKDNVVEKEYILAHEYFHILENKFKALPISIKSAVDIDDLEMADIFAFVFLTRNNKTNSIPKNVNKIMTEYINGSK